MYNKKNNGSSTSGIDQTYHTLSLGEETNSNGKSRVLVLATIRLVYSPCVAISVMLRVK